MSLAAPSDKTLPVPWLWPCFWIFLLSNLLLSYFPLDQFLKIGIGFFGILGPFFYLLARSSSAPENQEIFSWNPSAWGKGIFWVLLFTFAIFLRFHALTTLSVWPMVDEGDFSFFALNLTEKWSWNLFYGKSQVPPLYDWVLAFFYKIGGPSLGNLWLFPALLSLLALPLSYGASRLFFSRPVSVIITVFWATSFWPLFLGRVGLPHGLLLFWQWLAILAFGLYIRAVLPPTRAITAFLLGSILGSGFYVNLHWPVMLLWVVLGVGYLEWRKGLHSFLSPLWFLAPLFLIPLPLLRTFLEGEHGSYLSYLSLWGNGLKLGPLLGIWWKYLCLPLWGVSSDRLAYNPIWGGYLNPVMDTFLMMGFASLARKIRQPPNAYLVLGLVLFTLPALLTNQYEPLRVVLVLPFVLLLAAQGAWNVLGALASINWKWVGVGLILLSMCLDFYHLEGPYHRLWSTNWRASYLSCKLMERWQAYQILSSISRQKGPGLIFTEFDETLTDQTLTTAVYPFNASRNPGLSPTQAHWAGLITNINYAPFLSKRFPESRWFPLSADGDGSHATLVLGVLPLQELDRKTFDRWLEFEKALRPATLEWVGTPLNRVNHRLNPLLYPLLSQTGKDPFLESCLGERLFYSEMNEGHPAQTLERLHRALTLGYPAANLFNDLGVYWYTQGDLPNARKAFEAAIRSPLNHTSAKDNLRSLPAP